MLWKLYPFKLICFCEKLIHLIMYLVILQGRLWTYVYLTNRYINNKQIDLRFLVSPYPPVTDNPFNSCGVHWISQQRLCVTCMGHLPWYFSLLWYSWIRQCLFYLHINTHTMHRIKTNTLFVFMFMYNIFYNSMHINNWKLILSVINKSNMWVYIVILNFETFKTRYYSNGQSE